MNRLLAILVTLFILFLVYLWINHLVGSSQRTGSLDETTNTLSEEQEYDKPEEVYDIQDDDAPDEEVLSEESQQSQEDVTKETVSESTQEPVQKEKEPEPKPISKPAEPQVKKTVTPPPVSPAPAAKPADKDGGTHLVIAGNFIARANAEERVKELKKLGYGKAEVVNFELSEYHTACAGRYSDLNEARRVAKKIKDMHNIDTYVRHGN